MTEPEIRAIVRDEIANTLRPLILAIRQGNLRVNEEIEKEFKLGKYKES